MHGSVPEAISSITKPPCTYASILPTGLEKTGNLCEHTFVLSGRFLVLERAKGQFKIEGNVEDIFGGISGAARIARISQTCVFTGELEGESIAEYTAVLPREGEGSFQGFQRISGKLGEREGSFVVGVTGAYHHGQPRGRWTIVPKSGSGDFLHIRGEGEFELPAGKPATYRLEFDVRKPRAARAAADEVTQSDEAPVVEETEIVEAVAPSPVEIEQPAKPARRKQPKPVPAATQAPEPVEQPARPARRKKTEPAIAADQLPVAVAKPAPAAKPARRKKPKPVSLEPAPELAPEPPVQIAKPARRKKTPAVAAEPEPVVAAKPQRKSPRKKTEPVQTAAEAPAPVASKLTHCKKAAPVKEAAPAPVESTPSRRKSKPAPAEPVPLPVAQAKPLRQRRKAA
jgi:hypothetical protein